MLCTTLQKYQNRRKYPCDSFRVVGSHICIVGGRGQRERGAEREGGRERGGRERGGAEREGGGRQKEIGEDRKGDKEKAIMVVGFLYILFI